MFEHAWEQNWAYQRVLNGKYTHFTKINEISWFRFMIYDEVDNWL